MDGPAGTLDTRTAGSGPAALILHPHPLHGGTMGTRIVYQMWRQLSAKYEATRFDFRGVGGSAGSYGHGEGEVQDGLAMFDHVQPELVVGFSFGGAVAVEVAAKRQAKKLVILSTPNQIRDSNLNPLKFAPQFKGEAHVIVGDHDPFVPVDGAQQLADKLNGTLHIISGGDHFLQPSHHQAVLDTLASIA